MSFYVPEHTHIPMSRRTPPPTGDAELREEYKRTLDPFVALGMAAAATEHLVVGTGICLRRAARSDRHRQGDRDARPASRTVASCSASASAGTRTKPKTTAST